MVQLGKPWGVVNTISNTIHAAQHEEQISDWWFGTMEFYDVQFSWECHTPTDELICFRGVGIPPTSMRNQDESHRWAMGLVGDRSSVTTR